MLENLLVKLSSSGSELKVAAFVVLAFSFNLSYGDVGRDSMKVTLF